MRLFGSIQHKPVELGLDGGRWEIPSPTDGKPLRVIASNGGGWDHVSVSRRNRPPNWAEMCHVKDVFFAPEEVVMQLHPRRSEYVNNHPHCLHLWRPHLAEIPTPPSILVGVRGAENMTHEMAAKVLRLLARSGAA